MSTFFSAYSNIHKEFFFHLFFISIQKTYGLYQADFVYKVTIMFCIKYLVFFFTCI